MKKILHKFRARPYLWSAVLIIILAGGYFYFKSGQKAPPDTITVERSDIVQEVSVTGNTKPAQTVELSFESGGRISEIDAAVGDRVSAGQTLARVDVGELSAQLSQAQAQVAAAKAKLDELTRGTRLEDIAITKTELAQAEQNLTNLYLGIPDILNDAYAKANDAVRKETSGLFYNEETSPQLAFNTNNSQAKSQAEYERLQAGHDLNDWKTQLALISVASPTSTLDRALETGKSYLIDVRNFLNRVMDTLVGATGLVNQTTLATYEANVTIGINNVNTATANVNNREQAIAAQEITVTKAINQLALEVAGSTPEDIAAQSAQVAEAEANVALIEARLTKSALRSPLNGIVTRQDGKVGAIVSPGVSIISVISAGELEIEAFIPEVDIGKILVNNTAAITLDAYGDSVKFTGHVVFIEPAATVVEGVPTYKTTLQFDKEDSRVKPGMTANLDILTAERKATLILPQRSIIYEGGKTFVTAVKNDGSEEKQPVALGLSGSDGNVEILSGVSEGEKVLRTP